MIRKQRAASIIFLLVTLTRGLIASGREPVENGDLEECLRFSSEEVLVSVFNPVFRREINFTLSFLSLSISSIQDLHVIQNGLPNSFKTKLARLSNEQMARKVRQMMMQMEDLMGQVVKNLDRRWGRIFHIEMGMLDNLQASNHRTFMADLLSEVSNLEKDLADFRESIKPLLEDIGSSLASLFSPLVKLLRNMLKASGPDVTMEKLKEMMENMSMDYLLGNVLIQLVTDEVDGVKREQVQVLKESLEMAKELRNLFRNREGSKMVPGADIQDVWRVAMDKLTVKSQKQSPVQEEIAAIVQMYSKL